MGVQQIGKLIIVFGLCVIVVGIIVLLAPHLPLLNKLGKLPGDIRVQSKDGRFVLFAPIVSTLLVSVVLTLVINLLIRLFRK